MKSGSATQKAFATPRYEVHLPVAVWDSSLSEGRGVTEYMSNHDICFSVDYRSAIAVGTPVMLFVSMPPEVTAGNKVQLRASGRVVQVDRNVAPDASRMNLVAAMDWYDFVRADSLEKQGLLELQSAAPANSGSTHGAKASWRETGRAATEDLFLRILL